MASIIQLRRDTAAQWTAVNPVLANGEWGYETDTGQLKIGDGVNVWTILPYRLTSGEINTGSNVNTSGVGVFKQKVAADLEFRGIDAGSSKVSAVLNAANNTIEIDIDESQIDHLNILNVGANTHAQIDSHIADSSIHFTEGSIDHLNIQNVGSNTHAQIDSHIADGTIHFTEGSISHLNIQDIGSNTHAQIDTHISSTANPHSVTIDQVTPTTTKGDIIVENGTNAVRLGVGADGQVLKANSAVAEGVEWANDADGTDENVKVSATDTTPGFLIDKTISGDGSISFAIANPAADEDLNIQVVQSTLDHVNLQNIGTNTHAQIDSHIADTSIHFTEASIDHLNIQNIGTNTHAQIDTHIADATIHFTEGSISHLNIQDIGTNTHAQIDSHIADATIHFTEASIDHLNILNVGTNTHAQIDTHIATGNIHIDHSAVNVNAGVGLSGGGDITTSRTVDLALNTLPAGTLAVSDEIGFVDIDDANNNKKSTIQDIIDLVPDTDLQEAYNALAAPKNLDMDGVNGLTIRSNAGDDRAVFDDDWINFPTSVSRTVKNWTRFFHWNLFF